MGGYTEIVIRTVSALLLLLFVARILGKQTITSMTFHDFVTGITIGAIAANLAFNEHVKAFHFIASLAVITTTSFLLSIAALKSQKMRKWISGSPTVLIEGGKIMEKNMKKARYTLDSLNQALRDKDIFNLEEVEYAVLEDNGKLSVLKKNEYRYVTRKDLSLPIMREYFPVELIMDGKIMYENLQKNGLSEHWLQTELQKRQKRCTDVFYAVKGTHNQLMFDYYQDNIQHPIDQERNSSHS